jgi:hypothetical protein
MDDWNHTYAEVVVINARGKAVARHRAKVALPYCRGTPTNFAIRTLVRRRQERFRARSASERAAVMLTLI